MLLHGVRTRGGRLRARVADEHRSLPRGRLVEFVRLIFVVLFAVAGYSIGTRVGPPSTSHTLLGIVLGSATGFVLGGVLGRQTATAVQTIEEGIRRVPAADGGGGGGGLVMGRAGAGVRAAPASR